jgi:hypothetical protein
MPEEKTQAEIEAEEKAKAEADAKAKAEEEAKKNQPKVDDDGNVTLSAGQYKNLTGMKEDMLTYKERMKKAEAELEKKTAEQLKAEEDKLKEENKYKELYENAEKKNVDIQLQIIDNQITSALSVAALEAGISNKEYIKLIDKSKVSRNDDTGELSGIDEIVAAFKEKHPDLFKSEAGTPVDTGAGGKSGAMSDDDVRALSGKRLMEEKAKDSALYKRWCKLATQGKPHGKPSANPENTE